MTERAINSPPRSLIKHTTGHWLDAAQHTVATVALWASSGSSGIYVARRDNNKIAAELTLATTENRAEIFNSSTKRNKKNRKLQVKA